MKQFILRRLLPALALGAAAMAAQSAAINPIAYNVIGNHIIGFDGLSGSASSNGRSIDDLETLTFVGRAKFGESFSGQTLSASGDFDVLSGSPYVGELELKLGASGQNLMLINAGGSPPALGGIGPGGLENGEPAYYSGGHGAISILFDVDQSLFGFKTIDGTSGTVYLAFFNRKGGLIDSLTVSGLTGGTSFAFEREGDGSLVDIAGVSIWNDDENGMYFDSFLFNVLADDPGNPPGQVSEPGALALAGFALLAAGLRRRRR